MEQHVVSEFDGVISGVTSFGLFIELDESKVNGLVHVPQLPNDYYHFDPIRKTLSGERSSRQDRLHALARLVVLTATQEERQIHLPRDRAEGDHYGPNQLPPRGQPAKRSTQKRRTGTERTS